MTPTGKHDEHAMRLDNARRELDNASGLAPGTHGKIELALVIADVACMVIDARNGEFPSAHYSRALDLLEECVTEWRWSDEQLV